MRIRGLDRSGIRSRRLTEVRPTSLPISSDREAIVCLHWLVGLRPYRRPTLLSRALPTGAPIARTQQPTTPMHEHGIESGNTSTVSAPSRKVSRDWPQHGTPRRCSCFAVAGGKSWLRVARDAALQAQQTGRPTTAPRLLNVSCRSAATRSVVSLHRLV